MKGKNEGGRRARGGGGAAVLRGPGRGPPRRSGAAQMCVKGTVPLTPVLALW